MPEMKIIGHVVTGFSEKFGVPRQSGLVETKAAIVLEPEYRKPEAFRGIEGYSHLWVLWMFSQTAREDWSPTVRPPRLGGNRRVGVFATRSPFRPNPIGLSSVKLEGLEQTREYGPVLRISGADMVDGTPVFDIKPYLAYTDSHPEALGGFTDATPRAELTVVLPDRLREGLSESDAAELTAILAHDPRPSYQHEPERVYGMDYGGISVKFSVDGSVLTVRELKPSGRMQQNAALRRTIIATGCDSDQKDFKEKR